MRAHFGQDSEGVFVSLSDDKEVIVIIRGKLRSDILELFKKALKKAGVGKEYISEIAVDHGPGGFSAVRARVSLATSLAVALGSSLSPTGNKSPEKVALLSSKEFSKTKTIEPQYDGEPNITKSKKGSYV